jgi:hypothetical protein
MTPKAQTVTSLAYTALALGCAHAGVAVWGALHDQPIALLLAATLALRSCAPRPSRAFRLTCSAAVVVMVMLALSHAQGWALLSLGCWVAGTGFLVAAVRVARSLPTDAGPPPGASWMIDELRRKK